MTWIGVKKVAFVPLHRPNAHPPDEPVPPDWPNQILRRVLYDPDSKTGIDRSLRAYIHTASSGLADIDATVMPMQILDQQDVPVDALDGQLGSQLRSEGFNAAAIVMLGQPPTGTAQRGGFWARFDMSEGLGVWAMELMHCLTGFDDLYPFNGNMGGFDQMACNCGTHPSAYTKAAISWIDASAIAQHTARTAEYNLHSVGLVQPPPSGRSAAVRIGSQVPYLMVEARQKVDQFDANIPAEGVIVYRVQTTDPLGHTQNSTAPVELLTISASKQPDALKPGMAFTSDTGVTVEVLNALPGGFTVRVDDPTRHVIDRSAQYNTPPADGVPAACVIPGLGVHNIAYRDTSGHLHELWRDSKGATGTTDLTANAGAPAAIGNPFAYVDPTTNSEILLYRGADNNVHSLYWSLGSVGHDNLTGSVNAPKTAGDPVGWITADGYHHVCYRTGNGHLQELYWTGPNPVGHGDLTAAASAPAAAGDPSAYVDTTRGTNIVVYRSVDGRIRSLYWQTGAVGHDDLSGTARTPAAAGDPVAYYTAHDDTNQIVYRAANGHLYELYWPGEAAVVGWDLTAAAGAPPAIGNPAAYYSAGTNTKHVFYRSVDGRLHELWWVPGGGAPGHVDLNAAYGAPLSLDRPAAFTVEGPNTQHVAYRGPDSHIYEMLW
jgi:hypothetical protein